VKETLKETICFLFGRVIDWKDNVLFPLEDEPAAYQVVGGVNAHQAYDG
jgi:hypothetical protein